MAIEIKDKTFGTLIQYQNCDWEFEFSSDFLEEGVTITISGNEAQKGDLPSAGVYESFKWFRDNQLEIKNMVAKRIFDEYQSNYQLFREGWGCDEEADERAPHIENESQIWDLMQKPKICFSNEYCDFSIHWQTTWDTEHGILLFFKNGEIIHVE